MDSFNSRRNLSQDRGRRVAEGPAYRHIGGWWLALHFAGSRFGSHLGCFRAHIGANWAGGRLLCPRCARSRPRCAWLNRCVFLVVRAGDDSGCHLSPVPAVFCLTVVLRASEDEVGGNSDFSVRYRFVARIRAKPISVPASIVNMSWVVATSFTHHPSTCGAMKSLN